MKVVVLSSVERVSTSDSISVLDTPNARHEQKHSDRAGGGDPPPPGSYGAGYSS